MLKGMAVIKLDGANSRMIELVLPSVWEEERRAARSLQRDMPCHATPMPAHDEIWVWFLLAHFLGRCDEKKQGRGRWNSGGEQ